MASLVKSARVVLSRTSASLCWRANGAPQMARAAAASICSNIPHNNTGALMGPNVMPVFCNIRLYSADAKPTLASIQERVLKVVAGYDKVTEDKLKLESHFINDLGLDSLDHVEVVMALEDEFGFEIPDQEAEKLFRPADIVKYIAEKEQIAA